MSDLWFTRKTTRITDKTKYPITVSIDTRNAPKRKSIEENERDETADKQIKSKKTKDFLHKKSIITNYNYTAIKAVPATVFTSREHY